MKKVLLALMLAASFSANAAPVAFGDGCSYGAPISAVYQQQDGKWVIQVYGGINATNGNDLVVNHSQLIFKGIKGTKNLNAFQLGWGVEDKGFGGVGNELGQCDYTISGTPVYIYKK
jgi:hypothetical protein